MALLWVHVCSQYTTTYPSKPSPYEATEFILLVSWTVRVVVQDIYTATSTIQSLGVGLVFLAMRYLWHRDELSACTMAMCCGSPYHLILSPITIWSVESRELFCLCLAITGAQTLRTNQALKVGQLDPTQLRGIGVKYIIYIYIYTVHGSSFYISRCIQKTAGQWRGRCRRQLQLHKIQGSEWVPHTHSPPHISRQNTAMLCNQTQKPAGTIRSHHLDIATVYQEMRV